MRIVRLLTIALGLFGLLSGTLLAQHPWFIQKGNSSITLEIVKGFFADPGPNNFMPEKMNASSLTFHIHGRYEVQPGLVLVGDIPYVTYTGERSVTTYYPTLQEISYEVSGNSFGNIYAGIEAGNADRTLYADAGIRIPVVDYDRYSYYSSPEDVPANDKSFALRNAWNAEQDLYGAFYDNIVALSAGVNWEPKTAKPWHVKARLGIYDFYPHREHYDYALATLTGGLALQYEFPYLTSQLAYGGWLIGTSSEPLREMLRDYLALGISIPVRQWDFALVYRAPLRTLMRETVTDAAHFAVTYNFKR